MHAPISQQRMCESTESEMVAPVIGEPRSPWSYTCHMGVRSDGNSSQCARRTVLAVSLCMLDGSAVSIGQIHLEVLPLPVGSAGDLHFECGCDDVFALIYLKVRRWPLKAVTVISDAKSWRL